MSWVEIAYIKDYYEHGRDAKLMERVLPFD
jgi:hypothetical protein